MVGVEVPTNDCIGIGSKSLEEVADSMLSCRGIEVIDCSLHGWTFREGGCITM